MATNKLQKEKIAYKVSDSNSIMPPSVIYGVTAEEAAIAFAKDAVLDGVNIKIYDIEAFWVKDSKPYRKKFNFPVNDGKVELPGRCIVFHLFHYSGMLIIYKLTNFNYIVRLETGYEKSDNWECETWADARRVAYRLIKCGVV